MAPFIALVVLLFIGAWSSAFFLPYVRRHWRELEAGESELDAARLQESIDDLTTRVIVLEEERDFYRELRSSEDTPQIESGSDA